MLVLRARRGTCHGLSPAAPVRRSRDFGVGAGPETGRTPVIRTSAHR